MGTRRILIGCGFSYAAAVSTPTAFHVQPTGFAGVSLEGGQRTSEPVTGIRGDTDLYGNRRLRTVPPAGRSRSGYRAVAAVPDETEEADQDAPECEPDALPTGWGRDASDVAMATIFGGPLLESILVQAEETRRGKELDDARRLGALRSGARPPRA